MLKSKQILQDRYCLQEQLSQNPTRQTWRAEDTRTHQKVIVKLLPFSPQTQWQDVKLFEREAQILKYLDFAKIPRYLDYFSIEKELGDGLPWFALVQNYIPGSSLQQLLKSGQAFTEPVVKEIAQQLLDILIHLHELSPPVLHRDIKPSNIIQGQDGKIHLVDFGAVQDKAKAEGATFTVVGTGGYAPPEQLWGKAVAASDLYALGATLIHLLTGAAPGELPQHRMRLQFRDKVTLSPEFAAWLDKLIEPAVERRYGSAREALAALQQTERQKAGVKVRYGRLGRLALLQYGAIGLCLLALPMFTIYRYLMEGINNVGTMNSAQQGYFLQNNEFADTLEQLDIRIPQSTRNYRYETVRTPLFVMNYAIPKERKVKGYVGIVAIRAQEGDDTVIALLCEDSDESAPFLKEKMRTLPWMRQEVLRCAPGTKPVGSIGEILPEQGNWQLAYRAVHHIASYPDRDRPWQTLAKISDPEVKAIALETMTFYLSSDNDLESALKSIETIEDREVKARLLLALTWRSYPTQKPERLVEIRDRALDILQPIALHRDDRYKMWVVKEIAPSIDDSARLEAALQIASEMDVSPSKDFSLPKAFGTIAANLKTSAQMERVLDFISQLSDDFNRISALRAIAPYLKTDQQYNRALSMAMQANVNDFARSQTIEDIEWGKRRRSFTNQ